TWIASGRPASTASRGTDAFGGRRADAEAAPANQRTGRRHAAVPRAPPARDPLSVAHRPRGVDLPASVSHPPVLSAGPRAVRPPDKSDPGPPPPEHRFPTRPRHA